MRIAVLLVMASISANALTLADLRTQARVLVSDSGAATARYRFTDAQIGTLIEECQDEAVAQTWPLIKSSNVELVAGTTYYTLPNSFLAIKRVTWRNRVISEKSPVSLDSTKEWETISGTPQNYFITFASRTMIGIYPYPADSTSTGTVKVEFFAQADDLTTDASVPFNGVREFYSLHSILAYCAAARMAAIDGQANLIPFYQQIYTQGVLRLAGVAMARPSNNPSFSPGIPSGP